MSSDADFARLRTAIEGRLERLAPAEASGARPLAQAMRAALLQPGKRSRPLIALLCAEHFGAIADEVLDLACAFEMVHAASLVFDDLPCMDDAAVRRGRPTIHRTYGEDAAVLAGVGLLNAAYATIAGAGSLSNGLARRLVIQLSEAVGLDGLIAGQMRDLRERSDVDVAALASLNHQKTGVLFCAAAEAGAAAGRASEADRRLVSDFARHLGAAYQIRDDLLDATADGAVAGKDVNQDADKPTFVTLLGVGGTRRRLREEVAAARQALERLGRPASLTAFSERLLAVDWTMRGDLQAV